MPLPLRQTLAYFAAYFTLGAAMASLGPTLPFLADNTGASLAQLGLLFTLRSGGYLSGSLLGGRLYDRLPGHRLLAGALFSGSLCLFLIPEIGALGPLILLMLLIGLAESTLDVGSSTQLVWVQGPRSGPFLNGLFLAAGVGGMLSPLVFSVLGGIWGYRALGLFNLPLILWTLGTPSPQPDIHNDNASNGGLSPALFAAFCLLVLIYIGGEVGFSGWIFTYALNLNLETERSAGLLTSFYWFGLTLGRLSAIFTSTRFRPNRIVLTSLTGLIASLGLILLDPGSRAFLWIGTLGFGYFLAPVFPTTFAFLERQTTVTGTAAGVLWASGSFGAMLFPWIMGIQLANLGPTSIMMTLAGGFILALGLFSRVSRASYRGKTTSSS